MSAYFDSAILVKLYAPEGNSKQASELTARFGETIPVSDLQYTEVVNAILLKQARSEISASQAQESLRLISEDLAIGRLDPVGMDWSRVFGRSRELAKGFTAQTKARTLDILHVASAEQLRLGDFVSFDLRQIALAKAIGLNVISS